MSGEEDVLTELQWQLNVSSWDGVSFVCFHCYRMSTIHRLQEYILVVMSHGLVAVL